ncbi:MAG TPA: hypothetical protein VFT45_16845, partial [Longimicrobium sp.]|nr:hypothetical protein [Longimicrobium sp.]
KKPMAGIVAALLLGVTSLVIGLMFITDEYDAEVQRLQWAGKAVHVLGNLPLLAGALMSLAGNARGNRVVRATSKGMVVVILALLLWTWIVLAGRGPADGDIGKRSWAPLILFFAAIGTAPWLLYLFLFRKSRYP